MSHSRFLLYRLRFLSTLSSINRFFAEQQERFPLWFVVGILFGSAGYFILPFEPSWLWLLFAFGFLCIFFICLWFVCVHVRSFFFFVIFVSVGFVLGFLFAYGQAHRHEAAFLSAPTGIVDFEAQIKDVASSSNGWRFVLEDVVLLSADGGLQRLPFYVRLSMRGFTDEVAYRVGQKVSGRGRFFPPSPPSYAGGFDFARRAWFKQTTAFGYSLGFVNIVTSAQPSESFFSFRDLRHHLETGILQHIKGDEAAVAVALLLGSRERITEKQWNAMRSSGLAHLLALSGLHMGLVAGFVFFLVWTFLALCGGFAIRYNARKIAAVMALFAAWFYMSLTGGSLPITRAFIMVAFVLVAILLDRRPFTLYVVAWAAAFLVFINPSSVVDASFQMSFSAVMALTAFYEHRYQRRQEDILDDKKPSKPHVFVKARRYLYGIVMMTLVASIATMPFISYHFHALATYGLLANIVGVPLMTLWIMPSGILGILAHETVLAAVFLELMAMGLTILLDWSVFIADLPQARLSVPSYPWFVLVLFVLALLWVCLWQRCRFVPSVLLAFCAFCLFIGHRPVDIFIHTDGSVVALRHAERPNHWLLSSSQQAWQRKQWLDAVAAESTALWRDVDASSGLSCDEEVCLYRLREQVVSFILSPSALSDECRYADMIVMLVDFVGVRCQQMIDLPTLRRKGTHNSVCYD